MTLVYNLIRIEDIINDGFTLELPENTIEIINNISAIVGSATYVKTPVFHKKSKNEKKRSSEPPVPRPVVEKTKFEEYCGRIATNFNKLTEKNFSKLEKEIIDDMSVIVDELSENEFNTIVNRLFEAATLNRYSSKCYANISISLMSRWDDIKSIFYNNLNTYLDTFNNIESVSPDKDYEKFCILNSINEKRRATGLFLVSLFHSKLFTMDGLTDIIVNLTDLLYKLVKEDEQQSTCEEIAENLYVLLIELIGELKGTQTWNNIYNKLINVKDLDKADNPSFTMKMKFRLMDILDKYK
jgi:hypothetical protein